MNAAREWPAILQFGTGATIDEPLIEKHYRRLARKYHPDTGGSTEQMQQLNLAKQMALEWVRKERQKVATLQNSALRQQEMMAHLQQMNNAMQQQMQSMYSDLLGQMGAQSAQSYGFAANVAANAQAQASASNAVADYLHTKKEEEKPHPREWWHFWKRNSEGRP